MSVPPSGRQFEIARGEQRATIVELGGGIREYSVGAREVLEPYPLRAICDGAHGAPLIPWPNRLADGRYSFDGDEHQLALSEPARRNAIHGLMRWRPWRAAEHGPVHVLMRATLLPTNGYPFALDLAILYELTDAGLEVTTSATNIGAHACPFGTGQHPYLSPGRGRIDECILQLAAATYLVSDERMIPVERQPVAGTPLDFSRPRRIEAAQLDVAFTDLQRDRAGNATVRLTGPDGCCVELWVDERHDFLELFSGDSLSPARRRGGLAAEPMTCAPNAFRSGEGLVRLEPGESFTSRWGVGLSAGGA